MRRITRKARDRVFIIDHANRNFVPAQAANDPKTLIVAANYNGANILYGEVRHGLGGCEMNLAHSYSSMSVIRSVPSGDRAHQRTCGIMRPGNKLHQGPKLPGGRRAENMQARHGRLEAWLADMRIPVDTVDGLQQFRSEETVLAKYRCDIRFPDMGMIDNPLGLPSSRLASSPPRPRDAVGNRRSPEAGAGRSRDGPPAIARLPDGPSLPQCVSADYAAAA